MTVRCLADGFKGCVGVGSSALVACLISTNNESTRREFRCSYDIPEGDELILWASVVQYKVKNLYWRDFFSGMVKVAVLCNTAASPLVLK